MCVSRQQPKFDALERGFTLIEVLISIVITMIVMASVFALLAQGQRAFEREPEIADLQQSARTVLDMVSRDILQAGSGLPPEFPAFSRFNGAGDAAPTDVIEMIGTFQLAGELYLDPEDVTGFVGDQVRMRANTTNFEAANGGIPGDMVIVYNDTTTDAAITPTPPQWALARVTAVVENAGDPAFQALVTLDYGEFDPQYSNYLDGVGADITNANFLSTDGRFARMTRVSVVRYDTVLDTGDYSGPPPRVLRRDVDFANNPQAVGYLENFQIVYTIGVTAPVNQDNPPDPVLDLAGAPMTAENMLAGVRISVTARSITAGMQGASEGGAGIEDDFIRKSFSTSVNPRNISAGINMRVMSAASP